LQKGSVNGNIFHRFFAFFVMAGFIPCSYSRFVKGFQMPLTDEEKRYTAWWQEKARKDIECAFGGVLVQSWFQVMSQTFLDSIA
jgi:Plant transposon protein